MKPEARVLEVTSTLQGEKVGMTIDDGALAHIMSVLTDLYSNPELAVIREYSTNAFDSHIEAGVTRPIEVTLPTALAPFFRVRDFGIGLDADGIRDIYSRYGASTKRGSNDVVGMLGLGCKSALTYTDQFTLVGVKDGIETQVSISRDEDGSGSMTIVAQTATDKENGVEVVVPVKRDNNFYANAEWFFSFWNEGSVLINGEQPKRVTGTWVADDLLLQEPGQRDLVVMGNVAYPWPSGGYRNYSRIAFVDIGAVNFTPSRESLQMTALTKDTLAVLDKRFNDEKDKAISKQIDEQPTKYDALKFLQTLARLDYGVKEPTYQGQTLPVKWEVPVDKGGITIGQKPMIVANTKYSRDKGFSHASYIQTSFWNKSLWFVGYDEGDFSPHKRKKLNLWLTGNPTEDNEPTRYRNQYIMVKEMPADLVEWVDPSLIFNWADVAAIKIQYKNAPRRDGRPTGAYRGIVDGSAVPNLLAEDIDTTKPIFYYRNVDPSYVNRSLVDAEYGTGYTLVALAQNRVAKFQRDFPMAVELDVHSRELAEKWVKSLTEDEVSAIHARHSHDYKTLERLDANRVDDPNLKKAIRIVKLDTPNIKKFKVYSNWVSSLRGEWKSPLGKYAMLSQIYTHGLTTKAWDEVHLYLNAVHAANKEA